MAMLVADLGQLQSAVDHMARFGSEVEACLQDVERGVASLRATWHGEASDSQARAQRQWEEGAEQMRASLEQLRKIAQHARENYSTAMEKNKEMWG